MARVNHKLVRQRLDEKRSSITDKQFFTSRLLAGHYEDIVDAQTRRYQYNRRVRVRLFWEPDLGMVADTDDFLIRINTGNKLVTDVVGRENRYQIVLFLFLMFFVNQRPITTIFSGITVVIRFMHGVIIYLSNLRVKVLLL